MLAIASCTKTAHGTPLYVCVYICLYVCIHVIARGNSLREYLLSIKVIGPLIGSCSCDVAGHLRSSYYYH